MIRMTGFFMGGWRNTREMMGPSQRIAMGWGVPNSAGLIPVLFTGGSAALSKVTER
jgi:hypothetical protein